MNKKDDCFREIYNWIKQNDCRSLSIVYRYAEVKYTHWLEYLEDYKFKHSLVVCIKARNYHQKRRKIKAPRNMTLFQEYGKILLPSEIEIDKER